MRARTITYGICLLSLWVGHGSSVAQQPKTKTTKPPAVATPQAMKGDIDVAVIEWRMAWAEVEREAKLMAKQHAGSYLKRNRVELIAKITKKYGVTRQELQTALEKPKPTPVKTKLPTQITDPKIEYLRSQAPEIIEEASLEGLYRRYGIARHSRLLENPDGTKEVTWGETAQHHAVLRDNKVLFKRMKRRLPKSFAEREALEPTKLFGEPDIIENTANSEAIRAYHWEYQGYRLVTSVLKSHNENGDDYFVEFMVLNSKEINARVVDRTKLGVPQLNLFTAPREDPKIGYLKSRFRVVVEEYSLENLYQLHPKARPAKSADAAKRTVANLIEDERDPLMLPRGRLLENADHSQEVIWWELLDDYYVILVNNKALVKRSTYTELSKEHAEKRALEPAASLGKPEIYQLDEPNVVTAYLWVYQDFRLISSVKKRETDEHVRYHTEFLFANYKKLDAIVAKRQKSEVPPLSSPAPPGPDSKKNP